MICICIIRNIALVNYIFKATVILPIVPSCMRYIYTGLIFMLKGISDKLGTISDIG